MAKSKETFNKKEKEKKRLQHRQEKKERKEERKANAAKGKSFQDMIAYIDENGNFTDTPPDPSLKKQIKLEDIEIGVRKQEPADEEEGTRGVIDHFNETKGFGFIKDGTGESIFFHVNNLQEPVKKGDHVQFEVERGPKGYNAVNVRKQ